jgi:hypothetical protein
VADNPYATKAALEAAIQILLKRIEALEARLAALEE